MAASLVFKRSRCSCVKGTVAHKENTQRICAGNSLLFLASVCESEVILCTSALGVRHLSTLCSSGLNGQLYNLHGLAGIKLILIEPWTCIYNTNRSITIGKIHFVHCDRDLVSTNTSDALSYLAGEGQLSLSSSQHGIFSQWLWLVSLLCLF